MLKTFSVHQRFVRGVYTVTDLERLLTAAGFRITATDSCIVTESLTRWIRRYNHANSQEIEAKLRIAFKEKIEHGGERRLFNCDADICFENRFIAIQARI
jgi:hypothetical protein